MKNKRENKTWGESVKVSVIVGNYNDILFLNSFGTSFLQNHSKIYHLFHKINKCALSWPRELLVETLNCQVSILQNYSNPYINI